MEVQIIRVDLLFLYHRFTKRSRLFLFPRFVKLSPLLFFLCMGIQIVVDLLQKIEGLLDKFVGYPQKVGKV